MKPRSPLLRVVLAALACLVALPAAALAGGPPDPAGPPPWAPPGGGTPPGQGEPPPRSVPQELIVRFQDGTSPKHVQAARGRIGAIAGRPAAGMPDTWLFRLREGMSVSEAIDCLLELPYVLWAEPNDILRPGAAPDDPFFAHQWGLHNPAGAHANAGPAWDITTGDPSVRVAIVDSGVDASHPDLAGRVDPIASRDVVSADPSAWGDATEGSHGTHVAGIVGARGDDGIGIAGVTWTAGLVAVRVCATDESCTSFDVAAGLHHAASAGVPVVNLSLASNPAYPAPRAVLEAFAAHPQTLFVVAAGNQGIDLDTEAAHPTLCTAPAANVLCVGAMAPDGTRAPFSNHGSAVDIYAPGGGAHAHEGILSTVRGGWEMKAGTSMAAPFASGAAALVLARRPGLDPQGIVAALLGGPRMVPAACRRTATALPAGAEALDIAAALDYDPAFTADARCPAPADPPPPPAPEPPAPLAPAPAPAPAPQPVPAPAVPAQPGPPPATAPAPAPPAATSASARRRALPPGRPVVVGALAPVDARGRTRARLRCPVARPCAGTLIVRARARGTAGRMVVVARRAVRMPARRTVPLPVRLAPRARMLLRRDARLAVRVHVVPVRGRAIVRRALLRPARGALLRPAPRRAVSRR